MSGMQVNSTAASAASSWQERSAPEASREQEDASLTICEMMKEAREKAAGAENDLFSAWNTYRWAVDYGIMN